MQWVLKILNQRLVEERKWLRLEGLGAHDVKYKHSARMARERIPQLEAAIKILGDHTETAATEIVVDFRRNNGVSAQAPNKLEPVPLVEPRVRESQPTTVQAKAKQLNLFSSIATLNPPSK